jgi:hypothetical protein
VRPGEIGTTSASSLASCTGRGADFVGDTDEESTKADPEEKRELYTRTKPKQWMFCERSRCNEAPDSPIASDCSGLDLS